MNQDIRHILEAAIKAPSGENSQPWRFKVLDNTVELYNNPDSDQSFFNYGQRGSYVAHGAAIENMVLRAGALGYAADVRLFPDTSKENLVATLIFEKVTNPTSDPIAEAIDQRCTNRKPYKKEPLTPQEKAAIVNASTQSERVSLTIVDDAISIEAIARIGGLNEQIMLSTPEIHQFFFDHVNWTEEEDKQKKVGFYIETLELPPPAKAMFKIFRHWSIMRMFNLLGFPKIVAKQNAMVYATASAVIGAIITDSSPESYIAVGRSIERMWLAATKLGLSIQPLAGTFFLISHVRLGEVNAFDEKSTTLLKDAHSKAEQVFNTNGKIVAMAFRVGRGESPTAQATRFNVEDLLIS